MDLVIIPKIITFVEIVPQGWSAPNHQTVGGYQTLLPGVRGLQVELYVITEIIIITYIGKWNEIFPYIFQDRL